MIYELVNTHAERVNDGYTAYLLALKGAFAEHQAEETRPGADARLGLAVTRTRTTALRGMHATLQAAIQAAGALGVEHAGFEGQPSPLNAELVAMAGQNLEHASHVDAAATLRAVRQAKMLRWVRQGSTASPEFVQLDVAQRKYSSAFYVTRGARAAMVNAYADSFTWALATMEEGVFEAVHEDHGVVELDLTGNWADWRQWNMHPNTSWTLRRRVSA